MAITPIQFLLADVATATNGSTTISIQGTVPVNTNASTVFSGSAVFIGGNQVVEGIAGTAFDPITGVSTITLRNEWPHPTVTARLVVFNTIEGLANAIQRARESAGATAEIQTAFGEVLTATTPTITININGVPTEVVPYGYLEAEVTALIDTATTVVEDITAVEERVTVVEGELDTIEGTLNALVTDAQTARTGAETAETNAELAESNINASLITFNSDLGLFNTDFAAFNTDFGTFTTDYAQFQTDFGTFNTNFTTFSNNFTSFGTDYAQFQLDFATIAGSVAAAGLSETNAAASAVTSENASSISQSNANYVGDWADQTGALNIPASVRNDNAVWQLAVDLPDVTLSEPSGANTDWFLIGVIGGIAPDSARLGNELPSFYATASSITNLVPDTRTVNGNALSSDINITLASLSGVPESRTVNGQALSSDITIDVVDPQTSINTANILTKVDKSFTDISIATALQIGGKYLSTTTNNHTLDDGVTSGDSFIFTWSDSTVATINAVSNIEFTNKRGITSSHTTRVFDYPIVEIVFVWNGTSWGIR